MQAEIENVIRAYKKEVGSEEKLLIAFLSALAVSSAARKRMTSDMARAVFDGENTKQERTPNYRSASHHQPNTTRS